MEDNMADKKTVTPEEKQLAAEKHVDGLVKKALVALDEMRKLNQEQVDYIVAKASVAALDAHGILAQHAVEETGRGVFEDKATKNLFACEHVVNNMRGVKTAGVIEDDPITGLTKIAEPVGVICGITPTTNPTSTAIFKSLIALKTRNPIVFAFHPSTESVFFLVLKNSLLTWRLLFLLKNALFKGPFINNFLLCSQLPLTFSLTVYKITLIFPAIF